MRRSSHPRWLVIHGVFLLTFREKLALFCQVPNSAVITMYDVTNIYHVRLSNYDAVLHFPYYFLFSSFRSPVGQVPLILHEQKVEEQILSKLKLTRKMDTVTGTPTLLSGPDVAGSVKKLSSSTGPAVLSQWKVRVTQGAMHKRHKR